MATQLHKGHTDNAGNDSLHGEWGGVEQFNHIKKCKCYVTARLNINLLQFGSFWLTLWCPPKPSRWHLVDRTLQLHPLQDSQQSEKSLEDLDCYQLLPIVVSAHRRILGMASVVCV